MEIVIKISLFLLSAISIFAQSTQDAEWVRVQSDNGEFSIEIPSNYTYFYDKEGFDYSDSTQFRVFSEMQMLNASIGKTVMSVEVYKVPSPKNYLSRLLEGQKFNNSTRRDYKQGEFGIKEFEQNKFKTDNGDLIISHIARFITSKTHLYIVTLANHGTKSTPFDKFLSSIQLGDQVNSSNSVKFSSKNPFKISDIFTDGTKNPIPRPTPKPNTSSKSQNTVKDLTPFIILTKPFATYTEQARKNGISGTIRMRITFEKTGAISNIEFLEGLPDGLNRNGFFAALRIKFIPDEKDGELQTIKKQVEYLFSM